MMAPGDCASPSATYPRTAAAAPVVMTARTASYRSAMRVAMGIANTRTTSGIASTTPTELASSPLAANHTGKNGIWTPSAAQSAE
jgi:hypothetical protein